MLTTLDHLEQHIKTTKKQSLWKSFAREIQGFTIFFILVFIVNSVVVNAQLYQEAFHGLIGSFTNTGTSVDHISSGFQSHTDTQLEITKQAQLNRLSRQIDILNDKTLATDFISSDMISTHLQSNIANYNLDFNMLPPSDRVIIPRINVNTPLLQSSFTKHIDEITTADFDKDLFNGVVQYPTTPSAGAGGNTLIFGHTSYESWKNNPYATIFSQLPKLQQGDVMQIIQHGKLYEYEVIGRSIVLPHKVNEEYLKYTDGDYLTLLGCYPIGSDKQRILVIGKLKQ